MENSKISKVISRFNYIKSKNKEEDVLAMIEIMKKLVNNINNNPNNKKYKQIRLTNTKLQNQVFNVDGVYDFFIDIGFYQDDEILYIENVDQNLFKDILVYIDGLEIQLKNMIMSKNMDSETIEKNRKLIEEIQKKKNNEMEKIKKEFEQNKKELDERRKALPVGDSKGNNLKFGMNLQKFEPPAQQGGWG